MTTNALAGRPARSAGAAGARGDASSGDGGPSGWSSKTAFILAAVGSAVGLGNIWKFPYIAGEHGGGAFVLVYLACVACIGLPVLIAEIAIGRRGGGSPIMALRRLAARDGVSRRWAVVGWLGLACAFLILSFYSVAAGWALCYLWFVISGQIAAAGAGEVAETMPALFTSLLGNPGALVAGHTAIMAVTIFVVARGVRGGLEKAVRVMVPCLFALLICLVIYAATTTGAFSEALAFLLQPKFEDLSWNGVLVALGHAFFTLSVGMTVLMAYGAHLDKKVNIASTGVAIAGLDTLVALLAGLAIFPIVIANGMEPGSGPGLVFISLPIAFSQVAGGGIVAAAFFLFLAVAALSSTISVLEPVVEYLDERTPLSRSGACLLTGGAIWLLGLGCAFAFNIWADITLFGKNFFDLLDFLTANIMLPLGGMLVALFSGYALSRSALREELGLGAGAAFCVVRFLLRYVAPLGVATVMIYNLL